MFFEILALDCSCPVQIFLQKTTRYGTVHSVFRRTINLAFNDTLICLLSAELPRMPNGIRISADAFATLGGQVREGMEVRVENEHIFIAACHIYEHRTCWEPRPPVASRYWQHETVAQHVSMLIYALPAHMPSEGLAPLLHTLLNVGADLSFPIGHDLRKPDVREGNDGRPQGSTTPTFSPSSLAPTIYGFFACEAHFSQETRSTRSVPESSIVGVDDGGGGDPCGRPSFPPIWDVTKEHPHIGLCGCPSSLMETATPLSRIALPWLRQLAYASWQQDRVMLATAVSKLAGLGPGLTPSGDDVLGGFAAVMVLLSPALSIDGCERVWVAELIAQVAGPRTTLISRVLLDYAAKGEVAEQVGDLLLTLARPLNEHAAVWQAAERMLAFGATSGADTLLGILLALRVLEGGFDDFCMI